MSRDVQSGCWKHMRWVGASREVVKWANLVSGGVCSRTSQPSNSGILVRLNRMDSQNNDNVRCEKYPVASWRRLRQERLLEVMSSNCISSVFRQALSQSCARASQAFLPEMCRKSQNVKFERYVLKSLPSLWYFSRGIFSSGIFSCGIFSQ